MHCRALQHYSTLQHTTALQLYSVYTLQHSAPPLWCERAYKNSPRGGTPKDAYHRIIGKEAWRSIGKEGFNYTLGMPPTLARELESLTHLVENILADGVPGGVMETGVWTGMRSMTLAAAFAAHGVSDRDQYLCDSFNGLPKPEPGRFAADKGSRFHKLTRHELGGPAFTRANFMAAGVEGVLRQHWGACVLRELVHHPVRLFLVWSDMV